ncbi:MAG: hypothetical protein Faunusvirus8_39 [Faunusvirus sp.]|jgi:hypothetical protein|uniref:Uncharacterized protein n=1 Tax=Faunusvirus sp. TaxID=2487766 RepID=A0A3G4ZWN0_9VIRU|nr:MAG: hypothetical protein Faunusvirus8_39 [Faunusvirus sp.]
MNYTVTNVPLKKLNTYDTSKRKCEHHKFVDDTEFMMYTITKCKKETAFVFDPEDFDVVNGHEWYSRGNGTTIYYTGRHGNTLLEIYLIKVIQNKHYPGEIVVFVESGKPDFRKSNLTVI